MDKKGVDATKVITEGVKNAANKGSIGQLTEKATKQLDTVKDKFQTKVAEVKDQFRQLGTPLLEFAGVNMSRITDTGIFGKNKQSPNPKPSNSSKPSAKDSKPAEGNKGTKKVEVPYGEHILRLVTKKYYNQM